MDIIDKQNRIIDELAGHEDWLDKYDYLVGIGKEYAPQDRNLKKEANEVPGCQSKLWISHKIQNNRIIFSAESDSLITKGMIALLLGIINGHSPKEINDADFFFFKRSGISTNLSPTRANGLGIIIKEIKSRAQKETAVFKDG